MNNNKRRIKLFTYTGIFAALICLTTAYLFHIPVGVNGGYVHIGDAFIYLAACILPMPYAMLAASIGAGLADLLSGAAIWMIPTMIIKPFLVIFFTRKKGTFVNAKNILGTFLAGLTGIVLYSIATGIMYGSWKTAFAYTLIGLVQPVGSAIAFVVIGFALDKIKFAKKLNKDLSE